MCRREKIHHLLPSSLSLSLSTSLLIVFPCSLWTLVSEQMNHFVPFMSFTWFLLTHKASVIYSSITLIILFGVSNSFTHSFILSRSLSHAHPHLWARVSWDASCYLCPLVVADDAQNRHLDDQWAYVTRVQKHNQVNMKIVRWWEWEDTLTLFSCTASFHQCHCKIKCERFLLIRADSHILSWVCKKAREELLVLSSCPLTLRTVWTLFIDW